MGLPPYPKKTGQGAGIIKDQLKAAKILLPTGGTTKA
jgi:hypothetical protein